MTSRMPVLQQNNKLLLLDNSLLATYFAFVIISHYNGWFSVYDSFSHVALKPKTIDFTLFHNNLCYGWL